MELSCKGCDFICKTKGNLSACQRINIHQETCQKFWDLNNIDPLYHQWCRELSLDRYDVYLINKTYNMQFIYSLNQLNQNKTFWLSLDKQKELLLRQVHADPIYEDDDLVIYVKYVNVLTRNDKRVLGQSLTEFVHEKKD